MAIDIWRERPEPVETFADEGIITIIDDYASKLGRVARAEFIAREMSLGERVSEVCKAWLDQEAHSHDKAEAVTLRGLHIVRYLEGLVTRNDGTETMRDYKLPVLEVFWQRVDQKAESYLSKLAFEKYGVELQEVDYMVGIGTGRHDATQTLGTLLSPDGTNSYTLKRRAAGWDGHYDDVNYIAEMIPEATTTTADSI